MSKPDTRPEDADVKALDTLTSSGGIFNVNNAPSLELQGDDATQNYYKNVVAAKASKDGGEEDDSSSEPGGGNGNGQNGEDDDDPPQPEPAEQVVGKTPIEIARVAAERLLKSTSDARRGWQMLTNKDLAEKLVITKAKHIIWSGIVVILKFAFSR